MKLKLITLIGVVTIALLSTTLSWAEQASPSKNILKSFNASFTIIVDDKPGSWNLYDIFFYAGSIPCGNVTNVKENFFIIPTSIVDTCSPKNIDTIKFKPINKSYVKFTVRPQITDPRLAYACNVTVKLKKK